ncbi:MAG TPA: exodeoxyribonuclease VII large subunit [Methanomicrobiales archaeon]|nr:exodeoxyribonuclease VII large subunit [Methanomicrobiales archaeon]
MDQVPAGSPPAPAPAVLGVADITGIVADALDDGRLQEVWIRGEITSYKHHHSGHRYFSLSEQRSGRNYAIRCIMWQSRAQALDFEPRDGLAVIALGSVQLYEARGELGFYVQEMLPAGAGEKHLLVERWKRELAAEGLFAEERKRPLPPFPSVVGVVTARTGAVLQDIRNVIGRRFPVEILLSPTAVQGDLAHLEIARAICLLDGRADVIIVARGGGSFDDLFPFNHPDVVRAIACCGTPVVSAVGHEVDHVLADLAADRRAPTPSAAAELVVPDRAELAREVGGSLDRMKNALGKKVQAAAILIEDLKLRLQPRRIRRRINEDREEVSEIEEDLNRAVLAKVERGRSELGRQRALLEGRSPLTILSRGYCIAEKEGEIVRSAREIASGDRLKLRMHRGGAKARVEEVYHDEEV